MDLSSSKMKVFKGIDSISGEIPSSVITIGNYDGVHLGHQTIIRELVAQSNAMGIPSILYTFDPHPQIALRPERDLPLLTIPGEKRRLLSDLGIDCLVEEPFTKEFASIEPAYFFEHYLMDRLGCRALFVGYDFCFGRGRSGNLDMLRELCARRNIELKIFPAKEVGGVICSSSQVRTLLLDGDVESAANLLGRYYSYEGHVVEGEKRGRTIGIPTANLKTAPKLMLKTGVYAVKVTHNQAKLFGICNIGVRPTFEGSSRVSIETHIFDWNNSIYGESIQLEFVKRLRDERRFASVDLLRDQIEKDIIDAKGILRAPERRS